VRLVTFRRGRGEPKPGAVWHDAVLDFPGLAKELAAQRGAVRRGRDGFPKSLLELIRGGETALERLRETWEYGKSLVDQQAIEELARRRLAYPLKRVRLLRPSPRRGATCSVSAATTRNMRPSAAPPFPSIPCTSPSPARRWWAPATTWSTTP
jgi:hypothetical protein